MDADEVPESIACGEDDEQSPDMQSGTTPE